VARRLEWAMVLAVVLAAAQLRWRRYQTRRAYVGRRTVGQVADTAWLAVVREWSARAARYGESEEVWAARMGVRLPSYR